MIYFLKLTLPQYYFNHSFLQQAFTRKSKNSCRFKNFQEYPRFCEHLEYSRKILNLHGLLDFLVKACRYWNIHEIPSLQLGRTLSLEFHVYSRIFKRPIPASYFKVFQALGITWIFKNIQAHKSWKFLEIPSSIFLQAGFSDIFTKIPYIYIKSNNDMWSLR